MSERMVLVVDDDAGVRQGLAHLLEAEGYAIVVTGTLSVLEQIALFRDAAVIVGQHGAALTNLLFAPRGALYLIRACTKFWT